MYDPRRWNVTSLWLYTKTCLSRRMHSRLGSQELTCVTGHSSIAGSCKAASCNLTPIPVAYIPMTRASPGGHIQQQPNQETLHAGSTASLRAGHRKPCGRGTGLQAKVWAWSAWTPHQAPCEWPTHTLAPTMAASTATSTSMVGHMCCAWYSLLQCLLTAAGPVQA